MTQPNTAISTVVAEREVEFVPFGADPSDPSAAIRLSVAMIKTFVAVKTRSGAVCDDIQAMKFLALCKARRLNPFEGDAYLIGFDTTNDGPQFSLVTAHQAFLKRAEVHPEFDGMESGVIIKTKDGGYLELQGDFYAGDDTLVGGWARVHFKTRKWPMYKKLRLQDFVKPFGVWKTNPGGMIVKCAEADALRSSFPTMMGGMLLQQEVEANVTQAQVLPATTSKLIAGATREELTQQQRALSGGPVREPVTVPAPTPAPTVEAPTAPRRGRPPRPVETPAPQPAPLPTVVQGQDPAPPGEEDPFAGNAAEPAPTEEVIQPIEVHDDPSELTTRIRNGLRALNLSEQTLVAWCRKQEMMSEKQSYISLMNTSKLKAICERWPDVVKELRGDV